ncbi:hypothetical protein AB0D67_38865 [Streptosporangium sp. NPDC048047]|uniref:hypothetical protein n=1 Tax=Streptosporangium sp. NPDC048047 TaxID=3155748 RepID=UPI0034460632
MKPTHEIHGQFLFLPPKEVQSGDILMEGGLFGPVATDPRPHDDGNVVLTIDGRAPVPVSGTNKVRLFRPDDPAADTYAPGKRHDAIGPLFDDLRYAARTTWHHLDERGRPVGWDLPGVFQRLPYGELTNGDIVLEPDAYGLIVPGVQGSRLMSISDTAQREPDADTPVRFFRPADPMHAAACMDPESSPGGYGPPCWESHSTDFCLSSQDLLDIACQLWPGLEEEHERAYEQSVALARQRDAAFAADMRASAARLETAMKAINDLDATISTRDQQVEVTWPDGSIYSIDSALCPADDHDVPHSGSPAVMHISRQHPEGKSTIVSSIAAVPFPPQYAHDARTHAEFALAAISRDQHLLTRRAPRQA